MVSKVAVVTGGNKGIGFAIVRALCKKFDGDVILTARDEARGKAAVQDLEKEGLHPKFHILDITKKDTIKTLASYLKDHYGGLDVLINNAAMGFKRVESVPFAEQAFDTIKVNYFATLDVCHELFPLLRKHARVVNVSSSAGQLHRIPGKELQQRFFSESLTEEELNKLMNEFVEAAKAGEHVQKGWGESAYAVSKNGVTGLTFIQHRKFNQNPDMDIVINAVHPGYVDTDMTFHKGDLTPDQGAESAVYCALLPPGVESPRGEFIFEDLKINPWFPRLDLANTQ